MKISDIPAPFGTPRKPGISLDFVSDVGPVINVAPEAVGKAVRAVAARAHDANDARLLLDVLGLLPTPVEESPSLLDAAAPTGKAATA